MYSIMLVSGVQYNVEQFYTFLGARDVQCTLDPPTLL